MKALRTAVFLIAAICGIARVSVAAEPSQSSMFTAADIFRLRNVGDIRISPDGKKIVYETSDTDIMIDGQHHAIRMVETASGRDRLLADAASSPRWSPDGRTIAYLASGPGGTRVMAATLDGRPPRQVARVTTH